MSSRRHFGEEEEDEARGSGRREEKRESRSSRDDKRRTFGEGSDSETERSGGRHRDSESRSHRSRSHRDEEYSSSRRDVRDRLDSRGSDRPDSRDVRERLDSRGSDRRREEEDRYRHRDSDRYRDRGGRDSGRDRYRDGDRRDRYESEREHKRPRAYDDAPPRRRSRSPARFAQQAEMEEEETDATVVPIQDRVPPLNNWDEAPKGFEGLTVEQVKTSGASFYYYMCRERQTLSYLM